MQLIFITNLSKSMKEILEGSYKNTFFSSLFFIKTLYEGLKGQNLAAYLSSLFCAKELSMQAINVGVR